MVPTGRGCWDHVGGGHQDVGWSEASSMSLIVDGGFGGGGFRVPDSFINVPTTVEGRSVFGIELGRRGFTGMRLTLAVWSANGRAVRSRLAFLISSMSLSSVNVLAISGVIRR